MLSKYYLAMLATLAAHSSAAALQPRKPTCTFKLSSLTTQVREGAKVLITS